MDGDKALQAQGLLRQALGDWWSDDRRRWCAYCGIPMRLRAAKAGPIAPSKATRDHVIPRKHRGGLVTIPACRACNDAKGALSLPAFLLTDHFNERRKHRHHNQWSTAELWVVSAFAELKRAEVLMGEHAAAEPEQGAGASADVTPDPAIADAAKPALTAGPIDGSFFAALQPQRRAFGTRPT